MKTYILGAGAMGTLYATQLLLNNQEVILFDGWKQLLDEAEKHPYAYRIQQDKEPISVPVTVKALDGIQQYEPADFIIIFVKTVMTENTVKLAKQMNLANEKTVILTCQGGFDNPKYISQLVPAENILVGCTSSYTKSAGILKITNFDVQQSLVWPYKCTDKPNDLCTKIVSELQCLLLKLSPAAIADTYKMQLYYTANIAVSAIVDMPFKAVNDTECGNQLLMHLADECAQVAAANSVPTALFNKEIARKVVSDLAENCPYHLGSMREDLANGRVTEIEGTSGALIRMANEHNIEIKYTQAVYYLVKLLEQKRK